MPRPASVTATAHASVSSRKRWRLTESGAGPMPWRAKGRAPERGGAGGRCYGDPSIREFDDEPPVYGAKRLGCALSTAAG